MFKVGDRVRIKPEIKDAPWFSNRKFTIIDIYNSDLVELNIPLTKNLKSTIIDFHYLELDVKETRKLKWKKIYSRQVI